METDRIVRATPVIIQDLLDKRRVHAHAKHALGQRSTERWPFPGTIEVWLPQDAYGERHMLCTLHNLSGNGLALRARRPIATGARISFALHQPEMSCFGAAIVRHCTRATSGYLIGIEFSFDEQPEA